MTILYISIGAISAGGKTTFATELQKKLQQHFSDPNDVFVVAMDDFYRTPDEKKHFPEELKSNFDVIEAYNTELLNSFIKQMENGQSTIYPSYDFISKKRIDKSEIKKTPKIVIVEGIKALHRKVLKIIPHYFGVAIYRCPKQAVKLRANRDLARNASKKETYDREYKGDVGIAFWSEGAATLKNAHYSVDFYQDTKEGMKAEMAAAIAGCYEALQPSLVEISGFQENPDDFCDDTTDFCESSLRLSC